MSPQDKILAPRPTGTLQVSVASTSELFRRRARISIHDSSMMPVHLDSHVREFSLPAGLYQVSAVLQDGFEHRQLVRVAPDRKIRVDLGIIDPPIETVEVASGVPVQTRGQQEIRKSVISPWLSSRRVLTDSFQDIGASIPDEALSSPGNALETLTSDIFILVATEGARAEPVAPGQWRLDAEPATTAVPTATVSTGNCTYTISLPIARTPRSTDSGGCHLVVDTSVCGGRPNVWMAPERTIARTLQNMLASGNLSSAASTADDATEALREKYADPAGAALGALILHRVGRLDRWRDWLHNLADAFPWLPDGKILLATTLAQQRGDLEEVHALALAAAGQRILYAESFSLLLDLLRRWKGPEAEQPEHQQALMRLASQASFVDWSSVCLSISTPENAHV